MKLYSMKLYHGTVNDFDKFDTEHISSGEGHQVHGWGLYFAKDKDVAVERYVNRLAKRNSYYELTLDGKKYNINDDLDEYEQLVELGVPEILALNLYNYGDNWEGVFKNRCEFYSDESKSNPDGTCYFNIFGDVTYKFVYDKCVEAQQFINEHDVKYNKVSPKGTILTVEIPDDMVFIDEGEKINDDILHRVGYSNKWEKVHEVGKIITDVLNKYVIDNDLTFTTDNPEQIDDLIERLGNWIADDLVDVSEDERKKKIQYVLDNVHLIFGRTLGSVDWSKATPLILQAVEGIDMDWIDYLNGKKFYQSFVDIKGSPEEASLFLESKGINGITYWGNMDGRCYVIFNPNNINIVEKE